MRLNLNCHFHIILKFVSLRPSSESQNKGNFISTVKKYNMGGQGEFQSKNIPKNPLKIQKISYSLFNRHPPHWKFKQKTSSAHKKEKKIRKRLTVAESSKPKSTQCFLTMFVFVIVVRWLLLFYIVLFVILFKIMFHAIIGIAATIIARIGRS